MVLFKYIQGIAMEVDEERAIRAEKAGNGVIIKEEQLSKSEKVTLEDSGIVKATDNKKKVILGDVVEVELNQDALDEERDALVNKYTELYGKKPHPATGIEKLKEKIAEKE